MPFEVYGKNSDDILDYSFISADQILYGLQGNDTLYVGWGNDTLDGGIGIDTANYDSSFSVAVNLSTGQAITSHGFGYSTDSLMGNTVMGN